MSTTYPDDFEEPTPRWCLPDLPFAARLTLAVFLISVGIGYFSALVQLHMQHAPPGEMMPTAEHAVLLYHGQTGKPKSKIEVLLEAEEDLPFNGSGQMRTAFTKKSVGWDRKINELADKLATEQGGKADDFLDEAEAQLRKERDGERLAVLAWIKANADKKNYDDDQFVLPKELADHPVSADVMIEPGVVGIYTILDERCVRCHQIGGDAEDFPLDTYEALQPYVTPQEGGSRMSMDKLAQTTHVHLLGFSMLYGLTGLIFAFSSYPGLLRVLIAPAALVFQVVDISCWWLARMEAPCGPMFAKAIVVTGGLVGASLGLQIVLSLFNLFGKLGKFVLFVGMIAVLAGGFVFVKPKVETYLQEEKAGAVSTE